MKTPIFLMLIVAVMLSYAQEQPTKKTTITGGLKAETNLFHFLIINTAVVKSIPKIGGSFGGFVHFGLKKNFAIQVEMNFHYKHSTIDVVNEPHGKFEAWAMEIPVYVMYHIPFKNGQRLYIGVGPVSEFGLSATLKRNGTTTDLYKKEDTNDHLSAMVNFYSGIASMIGYEFPFGLQINMGYKIGLTNVLDRNSTVLKLLPNTFSIGIGYKFNKLAKKIQALENEE